MTEETVFLAALEAKDPAERAAYLDQACAGDAALRRRVEALLRSHQAPDNVLNAPAVPMQENDTEPVSLANEAPVGAETIADRDEALASLAPSQEAGSLGRLDHYEVLEIVGRGGMGVVFRAKDTKLQRVVAIKVLAPQLAANGTSRKRFVREAQAAAAVRDEHVVGIHAVSDDGLVPYLVMEFIAGVTLAECVRRSGPMEVKEILRIGMQAASGLAAAHAIGLIHRDVTPGNILLENGVQRVKLSDFGLARAKDDATLTQQGMIAGTPLYMSPEQARGERLDGRSDLFSLGSVLYTLCTGRPAFQATGTVAVLKRVCEDEPRSVRDLNPDIPEWLAALVSKLLAKDAAARFQSASELAQTLGEHLALIQQSGLAPRVLPSVSAPAPSKPTFPIRKGVRVAVLMCAVAATVVAAVLIVQRWQTPEQHVEGPAAGTKKDPSAPPDKPPVKKGTPAVHDPRLLTVSQKPEGGGSFRSISEALVKVEPGMTIRVLDDAVYEEHLLINRPDQHRGVILEAAGKATLRLPAKEGDCIVIRSVPQFTLRGFQIQSVPGTRHALVYVDGPCSGMVLDRLDMGANFEGDCINLYNVPLAREAPPIVIQGCTMRNGNYGVVVEGQFRKDFNIAQPCSRLVIRNNMILNCRQGVCLRGAVQGAHVVSNVFADSDYSAIDLMDLLPGARDVLIANNTLWRNEVALRIVDDHAKGKDYLKCKNMRCQNNLVIGPRLKVDMTLINSARGGKLLKFTGGDLQGLAQSPEWKFSHNWREVAALKPGAPYAEFWIAPDAKDRLEPSIKVLSHVLGNPNFLRPPKDSPLATAGVNDAALPPYIGAVPPEGVEPWNWDWTWDFHCQRLLTVAQKPEGGGRLRTISEALDKVEPGMTIRVLDDGVYDEHLLINRPEQHNGVVLEAAAKASIRRVPKKAEAILVRGVSDLTLRGFRIESNASGHHKLVYVRGLCLGLTLDRLHLAANDECSSLVVHETAPSPKDAPLVIQNCDFSNGKHGIVIAGRDSSNAEQAQPCGHVIIRDNALAASGQAIVLEGAVYRVHVVGNRIWDSYSTAVDLLDFRAEASDILIANNTMLRAKAALRVWDDHGKGKEYLKCKRVHFHNNLVLAPQLDADLVLLDHPRGVFTKSKPGDVKALLSSPEWRFSHNWREVDGEKAEARYPGRWIPAGPLDRLLGSIKVLSRKAGDVDFLRPPKDSVLATAGVNDVTLPPYVGAVPPQGVEPWDWDTTWMAVK